MTNPTPTPPVPVPGRREATESVFVAARYALWAAGQKILAGQLWAEYGALAARLAAAEADTARLDWMQEHAYADRQALTVGGSCYWSVEKGRKRLGEGDDLRDALDAARSAAPPPAATPDAEGGYA